jgi:putative transposase
MSKKAKQYSATEKTKIVLEAIKAEMTIAQISSKYGVHATQIQAWKKRGIENLVSGFQVKPATKDPDNEDLIKQLYEQIGQLSVERDWLKKNLHCLDLETRKSMIDNNCRNLAISRQCDLLLINKSTYYYKEKGLKQRDLEIMKTIDEIYTEHPYFGARRMSRHLVPFGIVIGRKAVSRYYGIMAIEAIYPKINLSKRNQGHKIYPYLLKGVEITKINQVWSTDITYIRMAQGFVYLVAIIDWFSRYILSWKVSISLESDFCIDALEEALEKQGQPEIFNTDQGSQFTSKNFIHELVKREIKISMDGKGRALDNVFIERFWRSLKQEKIYLIILNTVKEAKNAITDYITFYNGKRMHQSLEYLTPEQVYLTKIIG